jgi:hypothetical protein
VRRHSAGGARRQVPDASVRFQRYVKNDTFQL